MKPKTKKRSPSATQPVSGLRVFLGLLLTLLLHCLQLIPFGLGVTFNNDKLLIAALFFGLTQLLYMSPLIVLLKRRNERSLVIGLIIGASLTFLIGLPFAGLAYICGIEKRHLFG